MTSNRIRCAAIALVALSAAACRDTTVTDTGTGQDAGRDVQGTDVVVTDTSGRDVVTMYTRTDGGGGTTVTIRQIQDLTDAAHPASGARVTLGETGLVALSPRILLSAVSGSSGFCRFGVWVGNGTTGDFAGIQVQENPAIGSAAGCYDVRGGIPFDITPGTQITALGNVVYSEFCSGPTGVDRTMCRSWEQTQLGLRTDSVFTAGSTGTAPAPTTATLAEAASSMGTMPGTRSLAIEADLVQLTNVRIERTSSTNDAGTFNDYWAVDPANTASRLHLEDSRMLNSTCVRAYLDAHIGMTIPSVSGLLEPEFGLWGLHLRSAADFPALDCTADAGVRDASVDAAADVATGG
ncbi:MAG: hypothetical protein WCJ30_05350 [Deltaproteobacteria bacterium]